MKILSFELTGNFCLQIFIFFLLVMISPERKLPRFSYLALEPGADIPVIPGPAGTGIIGLYRNMESSRNEDIQNYKKSPDKLEQETRNRPDQEMLASFNREQSNLEIEIEIPKPGNQQKEKSDFKNKSTITTNRLNILEKEEFVIDENDKTEIKKDLMTGLPGNLNPTPRSGFSKEAPRFYKGIYLNNHTIRNEKYYASLLKMAKKHGINSLVIDVQPRMPSNKFVEFATQNDFYIIARIVVFDGGLKKYPPSLRHLKNITDTAEKSAKIGFMEVQLDYIRFADNLKGLDVPLKKRYMLISGILKMVTDRLRPYRVRIGADIFGRIAFNNDDTIGQKLEVFSPHLDTIYPMLYPSHFYGDPERIKNPYKTIFDGSKNCMKRVGENTRIVSYIQGFEMSVSTSGLSYRDYIARQIKAAEESGSGGYITWNAKNNYTVLFDAIKSSAQKQPDG